MVWCSGREGKKGGEPRRHQAWCELVFDGADQKREEKRRRAKLTREVKLPSEVHTVVRRSDFDEKGWKGKKGKTQGRSFTRGRMGKKKEKAGKTKTRMVRSNTPTPSRKKGGEGKEVRRFFKAAAANATLQGSGLLCEKSSPISPKKRKKEEEKGGSATEAEVLQMGFRNGGNRPRNSPHPEAGRKKREEEKDQGRAPRPFRGTTRSRARNPYHEREYGGKKKKKKEKGGGKGKAGITSCNIRPLRTIHLSLAVVQGTSGEKGRKGGASTPFNSADLSFYWDPRAPEKEKGKRGGAHFRSILE